MGYYFSGHLFEQAGAEVRRMVKRAVADLQDSRDPQMVAGIITDLRVVNGQRGKVAIFKLDDSSDAIEAVIAEELLNSRPDLIKEDELVIVQGKVQPDRFSGGVRLNVQQVWSLADARCRFGRYLRVPVNGSEPPIEQLLKDHPPRESVGEEGVLTLGLGIRLVIEREQAVGEIELGEAARFYPDDAALLQWARSTHGAAQIVYADKG